MKLKVGQRFKVASAIAEKYEKELGKFSFVVEITSLKNYSPSPICPPTRNIYFEVVDWDANDGYRRDRIWFACYSIGIGHDKYGDASMNFSPDHINGEGDWYLPDLFRWQHLFLYLYRGGAVMPIEDNSSEFG
ncbi:hypothetical protein [Pararcticibacter amylolyticus]|uniref:Uncharacterized protein n=1 Tax=Pararcticibacter amylolyticus TaxID=2173175 RepID=A0A2U2P9K0_9SPHI|nr:hypothetical protein [Pararcticibacter amylolyticus]PWG78061.1 hypothetical protein DDR33_24285 [Pararcticibacter amylolyticus]